MRRFLAAAAMMQLLAARPDLLAPVPEPQPKPEPDDMNDPKEIAHMSRLWTAPTREQRHVANVQRYDKELADKVTADREARLARRAARWEREKASGGWK